MAKISKNDRPVTIEYQINVCSWEIELDMDLSFLPVGGGFTTGKYTFPSARAAKVRSCPPPQNLVPNAFVCRLVLLQRSDRKNNDNLGRHLSSETLTAKKTFYIKYLMKQLIKTTNDSL